MRATSGVASMEQMEQLLPRGGPEPLTLFMQIRRDILEVMVGVAVCFVKPVATTVSQLRYAVSLP